MITGIVVALPEELATLISGKVDKGAVVAYKNNTLIALAGAGSDNARKAAELLIERGAGQLISWGCAAALSPDLRPGDLVMADTLLSPKGPPLRCNGDWVEHARRHLTDNINVHIGFLFSSPTIVAECQEKQRLREQSSALSLDMESYAIATAAHNAAIPCLVLRAIADPADMSLPQAVSLALNAEGEVELRKLLAHILRHPHEIPSLIKLGMYFSAAKKTLKFIGQYLDKIMEFHQNNTEH